MGIETWLNWISMGLIVLWTMRLAGAKRQNPWVWSLASIGLIAVPYMFNQPFMGILGMLPMLFLLVLKKPTNIPENDDTDNKTRINCSKCDVSHLKTYKYCVNCGWELNKDYKLIGDDPPPYTLDHPLPLAKDIAQPVTQIGQEDTELNSAVSPSATVLEDSNGYSTPEVQYRTPFRIPILSAESLTTKGANLFTEGRFQEAADQFTKAIALDPQYYLAWSKRAEAYLRMGMVQKAEEDLRNLESI